MAIEAQTKTKRLSPVAWSITFTDGTVLTLDFAPMEATLRPSSISVYFIGMQWAVKQFAMESGTFDPERLCNLYQALYNELFEDLFGREA